MSKFKRLAPLMLIILANITGFGILFYTAEGIDVQSLYYSLALLGVVLISYMAIIFFSLGDEYLFLIVSMLLTIGIITLFRINPDVAVRQIIWFYVGMGMSYLVYTLFRVIKSWDRIPFVYTGISVLLFLVTLVFGVSEGGAKNWIRFGDFGMQPSEIIKILFVLSLASMYTLPYEITDMEDSFIRRMFHSEKGRQIIIMAVTYMNLGFLVLQREWGSAVLYFLIYFVMQYVFCKDKWILILNVLLASLGGTAGFLTMTHIQERVAIWRDPFSDAGDMGYQIVQSLYAMASGGFVGSGIGQGRPDLIPVVKSDFIFSAIYEETGMLGATAVIILFFLLVYRGIKISLRCKNEFNKALTLGISLMFGFQTFIIIGGVIKFIPLTGITLPFMSAGGSSLASSFVALAILQAISARRRDLSDDI